MVFHPGLPGRSHRLFERIPSSNPTLGGGFPAVEGPSKWLDSVEFFEAVFFGIGKYRDEVNMGNYGFERWRF